MNDEFSIKEKYNIADLVSIMKLLRGENGCPWDREQTHQSIRNNFLEEAYEAVEAIDNDDNELLKEELGDVLLQIVFHSRMAEESGNFNFSDVSDDICKKLIIRHPHVFSDVSVSSTDDVLSNWDRIKSEVKGQKSAGETLLSVSRALPALMRSEKIGNRAKKAGFDFSNKREAFLKIKEEVAELETAMEKESHKEIEEELGDLLFSVVNLSRFLKVNSEEALSKSADKFTNRFVALEKLAEERGVNIKDTDASQLDTYWEEVK